MIGTIGYPGNAASLQTKNLLPHLHFGYLRAVPGIDGRPHRSLESSILATGFEPMLRKTPSRRMWPVFSIH